MRMIDPTYLRNIHDGLLLGTLHKDNASALPMGLVGMYEEALPPASNVNERKKFLKFFAVWALLKKEASVVFLMPLLEGWSEEIIIYYLNKYSKWFNSPQSGKYVLYHERLRAFILQKNSKQQFNTCNETIIKVSHDALSRRSGDEWENYALEYLSNHMLIPAIEKGDGSLLKLLAYNTTHWNRQVQISKGFEWSKRMLNDMMLWASKYDDEEVIECALNKVDLHHQEQNDAPRIVELVAQNDIETALQRIEAFGGNDKEGLQRKFILYMLCLMELTLLDSKDKPFRKEAIEKLLKHFDDNIPANQPDLINWNDFFPSYLMFQMACEWAEMGLDYLVVYKRTYNMESNWIAEKGSYSELQFDVLLSCSRFLSDKSDKSRALAAISSESFKHGKKVEAAAKMAEALACARGISNERDTSISLKHISTELAKQGNIDEAHACAREISDDYWKNSALINISKELAKQGRIEEALNCVLGVSYDFQKSCALAAIATEMFKHAYSIDWATLMKEALALAQGISDISEKSPTLANIATESYRQERYEEVGATMKIALACAKVIRNDRVKSLVLTDISSELAKQGNIDEALACAQGISDDYLKNRALRNLSTELAKQGNIDEALACAREINYDYWKNSALKHIADESSKQFNYQFAIDAIQEAIVQAPGLSEGLEKHRAIMAIAIEYTKQKKYEEALAYAKGIRNDSWKSIVLKDIAIELAKQGKNDKALLCSLDISRKDMKYSALAACSTESFKQGHNEEAASTMQEALDGAQKIRLALVKNWALKDICYELSKQGFLDEALALTREINDIYIRSLTLSIISTESYKIGKKEKAVAARQEALANARVINHSRKSGALATIATESFMQGDIEVATSTMQEAISDAIGLSNDKVKSIALKDIITELAKQGDWSSAEKTGLEIPQIGERQACWKNLAKVIVEKVGFSEAFTSEKILHNEEVKKYYLKGWAEEVSVSDCDSNIILSTRHKLFGDIQSLETLLKKYSLNELFFGDSSDEKINRLNRTLNIQWAIDIKNSFSASKS